MTRFVLPGPLLMADSAVDRRSEGRGDVARLVAGWPTARVLRVDACGRFPMSGTTLEWVPGVVVADAPPADGVYLGSHDGVDLWSVSAGDDLPDAEWVDLRAAVGRLTGAEPGLAATAVAMRHWHTGAAYSPVHGRPTRTANAGWTRVDDAGAEQFPRTDSAVIFLVHDGVGGRGERALLARGAAWPVGRFSTIAGFVEPGESLEQAVVREAREEVGIDVRDPQYLGSQPWPFPRSLMVGFIATADPAQPLDFLDGEVAEARWFERREIKDALAAGDWAWTAPSASLALPGSVSISRALIRAWADA